MKYKVMSQCLCLIVEVAERNKDGRLPSPIVQISLSVKENSNSSNRKFKPEEYDNHYNVKHITCAD